jgi:hypothetical protein
LLDGRKQNVLTQNMEKNVFQIDPKIHIFA